MNKKPNSWLKIRQSLAKIALRPLALLMVFVSVFMAVILVESSTLKNQFQNWQTIFTIGSAFGMSGIVSSIFYFVVVYLPERRQRQIIKQNLQQSYGSAKRSIAVEVLHASQLGGRDDLQADGDTIDKMLTTDGFIALFDKGREGHEGFYAFQNQMSERTPQYEEIIFNLKQISKSIDVIIDNYKIDDQRAYDFFRNIQRFLARVEFQGAGYDASKPLCRFVWEIFSGWDMVEGHVGHDKIESLIDGI